MATPDKHRKHVFFTRDLQASSPLARRVANGIEIGQRTARKISTHVYDQAKQRDWATSASEVSAWAKGMFGAKIAPKRIVADIKRYGAGNTPDLTTKRGPRPKRKEVLLQSPSMDQPRHVFRNERNACEPLTEIQNDPSSRTRIVDNVDICNHPVASAAQRLAARFNVAEDDPTIQPPDEQSNSQPSSPIIAQPARRGPGPPIRSGCIGIIGKEWYYDPWINKRLRSVFNSGEAFGFSSICSETLLNILNDRSLLRDGVHLREEGGQPVFRSIHCTFVTNGAPRCAACDDKFVSRNIEQLIRKEIKNPVEKRVYLKNMTDKYVATVPHLALEAIRHAKKERDLLKRRMFQLIVQRRVDGQKFVTIEGKDKADLLKRTMKLAKENMEDLYPEKEYGAEHKLFFAFTRHFMSQSAGGPKKDGTFRIDPELFKWLVAISARISESLYKELASVFLLPSRSFLK